MREITLSKAVNEAIAEEMRRDPTVFVIGEDVAEAGTPFKVLSGLVEEFGTERIIDTPISEPGFMGMAVGAAMTGSRPIVDLMFGDFLFLVMDQLCNQAAKTHYMSGGKLKVPLVLRTNLGATRRSAAQHSQSLHALVAHIPGLKVALPSSAYEAKGLLKTAIRDDNPVVIFEDKLMYQEKAPVPEEEYLIPFGKAEVLRPGRDITIVATSSMVQVARKAAELLERDGIAAEIIDPRTIVPLDMFRHPQLVVLFTLSVLIGFVMYSLIFFAPLLLQGGFGLSPQAAGLIATPLAACIALGSFINTPIVVRLSRPTNMLILGFCLLAVASAGVGLSHRVTSHGMIALMMGCAGIGIGFILNNMNVFGQEIAGRERFGITTALLQSTRMVGGMLGTTIVGTLVNHWYANGVAGVVSGYDGTPAAHAVGRALDPRILIDPVLRADLLTDLRAMGIDGMPLVETARQTLVNAVHAGVLLTGIAAIAAALLVRRIRQIQFPKRHDRSAVAAPE